jgi:hypothetical protein
MHVLHQIAVKLFRTMMKKIQRKVLWLMKKSENFVINRLSYLFCYVFASFVKVDLHVVLHVLAYLLVSI